MKLWLVTMKGRLITVCVISSMVLGVVLNAVTPSLINSHAQPRASGGQQFPAGYSLIPPGTVMETLPSGETIPRFDLAPQVVYQQIAPQDTIPQYALYGGATITKIYDAHGTPFMGCDAKGPDGVFLFYVFNLTTLQPVPLQYRVSGRGSVGYDLYSGKLFWIAWQGSAYFTGAIPSAVPFSFVETSIRQHMPLVTN